MIWVMERCKLVVEGAAAAPVGALLHGSGEAAAGIAGRGGAVGRQPESRSAARTQVELAIGHSERAQRVNCHSERAQRVEESQPSRIESDSVATPRFLDCGAFAPSLGMHESYPLVFERIRELLRRLEPIRIAQQLSDLAPERTLVEPRADPAARPDVRRREVAIGSRAEHHVLRDMRRRDPDAGTSAAVMCSRARVHREELVSNAKRRLAPRLDLVRFGQRETDLTQATERVRRALRAGLLLRGGLFRADLFFGVRAAIAIELQRFQLRQR